VPDAQAESADSRNGGEGLGHIEVPPEMRVRTYGVTHA